ncbi:unnamed protein product, partial [Ectocarpus sp. 12 AP-2014]
MPAFLIREHRLVYSKVISRTTFVQSRQMCDNKLKQSTPNQFFLEHIEKNLSKRKLLISQDTCSGSSCCWILQHAVRSFLPKRTADVSRSFLWFALTLSKSCRDSQPAR